MNYDWNFRRLEQYIPAFWHGTRVTLALTAVVILAGTSLGALSGVLMTRSWLRRLLYPLIDVIRAIPPLVLLLFCYYFISQQVIGVTLSAFWVAAVALSVNLAAFTADVVRAALADVPAGPVDAGLALGMSKLQLRIHIVLPRVWRAVLPAMLVLYIGMLKATSLASVITVYDVVFSAQVVITTTARSLEAWTVVALIYVSIVVPATYGARVLERWARTGQQAVDYR